MDEPGLERILEHVVAGGVHGVFVLGTTGEGPSLGYALRRKLIERACRVVAGRIPVLVGISDNSLEMSLEQADWAVKAGADAVVSAGPGYFALSQPELLEYLRELAGRLPLPLFLYNMPSCTRVHFDVPTVERAMEIPGIVGLKDSAAGMIYLNQLIQVARKREDFAVFVGPEELMAESVLMGIHGGVNGGSNLFPRLYVKLFEAARAGRLEEVRRLQAVVLEVSRRIYRAGSYGSSYLKGIKCAAAELGLIADGVAWPYTAFTGETRTAIGQSARELAERIAGL